MVPFLTGNPGLLSHWSKWPPLSVAPIVLALIEQACSWYPEAEHVNIDLDEMLRLWFK
jgi:ferric iron reductase protein FhuF